jgi:antitoxin (DNA-binding transcriptional repressor) of toxin-antitoxin stability system
LLYYWTMIKLNVHEAKTHSGYLAKLKQGETIVLRKRNRPIAARPDAPRPIGLAKGQAIAQGLMIFTLDPDITPPPARCPARNAGSAGPVL